MKFIATFIVVVLFGKTPGFSQGFVNLNFESANTSGFSSANDVNPTSAALPGWTAYYANSSGTHVATQIWYDSTSLGGAFVSLTDTNNQVGLVPLQGHYSVLLEGSAFGTPTSASIGQTGKVPANASSITFFLSLYSSLQVTFDGQPIPLIETGATPNYDVMAGNISAFAGQTGQLLFTAPGGNDISAGYGLFDNVQFSTSPVPEPNALGLTTLGGLILASRLRKARAI